MPGVVVTIGDQRFDARLELTLAPRTCEAFVRLLPYRQKIIHVRWSGEACWIPLGGLDLALPFENATSYPAPGQFLFYPGGYSETEILLAYGPTQFSSKLGQLAGSPFLTIVDGLDRLAALGRDVLWQGAKDISFEAD